MNILNRPLKGQIVLVRKEFCNNDVTDRRFLCEDGFGCDTFTNGEGIFGKWLVDGEQDRINSRMIEELK